MNRNEKADPTLSPSHGAAGDPGSSSSLPAAFSIGLCPTLLVSGLQQGDLLSASYVCLLGSETWKQKAPVSGKKKSSKRPIADFHMHLFSQNRVTQPPQAKVVWWSGKAVLVGRIGSQADGSSVRMEVGGGQHRSTALSSMVLEVQHIRTSTLLVLRSLPSLESRSRPRSGQYRTTCPLFRDVLPL